MSRVLARLNVSRVLACLNVSWVLACPNVSRVLACLNVSRVLACLMFEGREVQDSVAKQENERSPTVLQLNFGTVGMRLFFADV